MNRKVPIIESLNFAYVSLRKDMRFFLKIAVVYAGICMIPNLVSSWLLSPEQAQEMTGKVFALNAISLLIKLAMLIGLIKVTLRHVRGAKSTVTELFDSGDCFLKCVATGVLYMCLVMFYFLVFALIANAFKIPTVLAVLGLAFILIPTIRVAIKYKFWIYLIIDHYLKPIAALRASEKMTRELILQLLGFKILCMLINIAGATFFLVGLLITLPLTALAESYVYNSILNETNLEEFGITAEDQYSESQDDQPPQEDSDC